MSLSYSSLLKHANKSGGSVIPAYETVQSLGNKSVFFLVLGISWHSFGSHKNQRETLSQVIFQRAVDKTLIIPYLENNQEFTTATCEN